jgi:thioredoxin-related protein
MLAMLNRRITIIITLILFIVIEGHTQSLIRNDKKGIPPFQILLDTGDYYTSSDLMQDKPVMIIYFDPGCDHCQLFTSELLANIRSFSDVQIVMVTYVELPMVKDFTMKNNLSKYPSIHVGTEGYTFVVQIFYRVRQFPFIALYKNYGTLLKTYEGIIPDIKEVADWYKNLN